MDRVRSVLEMIVDRWVGLAVGLDAIDPSTVWYGRAVEVFVDARDQVTVAARLTGDQVGEVADVVASWADDLADLQADGRRARDDARQADDDLALAWSGLGEIADHDDLQTRNAAAGLPIQPWYGPDWQWLYHGARERRDQAQHDFDQVVARHDGQAIVVAQQIRSAMTVLNVGLNLGTWAPFGARAGVGGTGAGQLPVGDLKFVRTPWGLVLNTAESWRDLSYVQAGVDRAAIDAPMGLEELRGGPARLWEFYGRLYQRHPEMFQWAGMANLAGIMVHSGIEDLVQVRKLVETGTMTPVEAIEALFGRQLPEHMEEALELAIGPAVVAAVDMPADDFVAELVWVEGQLLDMQQAIFDDLGWQHLAYAHGGIQALEAIHATDPHTVNNYHLDAWRLVADGRDAEALRDFADYEQNRILQPYYDRMLARKPVPWVMTWAMSVTARSPTPSGGLFWMETWQAAQLDTPDQIIVWPESAPGDPWTLDTPDAVTLYGVPGEMPPNIAYQDDRWEWVRDHMADQYLADLDSGAAQVWIADDLQELAQLRRLVPDVPFMKVED